MSHADKLHEIAARQLINRIRNLSDAATDVLIAGLSKDPDLIEGLSYALYEEPAHLPPPPVEKVKFRMPDNSEHEVSKPMLEAMIRDPDAWFAECFLDQGEEEVARIVNILVTNGFPIQESAISFKELSEGEILIYDRDGNLFAHGSDHSDTFQARMFGRNRLLVEESNHEFRVVCKNERVERQFVDIVTTASHVIDYSLGEGQYINRRQSEDIVGEPDNPDASSQDLSLVELHFREIGPRGRLEALRSTLHQRPSTRGPYRLLGLNREGVTLLLYRNRVVTFGWTRKLPSRPAWRSGLSPAEVAAEENGGGRFASPNRYTLGYTKC